MEDQSSQFVSPDVCNGSLHPQAIIGLELFNAREYFEAHEALETAWREETGPVRELYRGILQVAVAYLHIQRSNFLGARKMFRRCHPWLDPFQDDCRGINIGQLKRDYQAIESLLVRLGPKALHDFDQDQLKPIIYTLIRG
jgi:predicted metal-dependent hydrolase